MPLTALTKREIKAVEHLYQLVGKHRKSVVISGPSILKPILDLYTDRYKQNSVVDVCKCCLSYINKDGLESHRTTCQSNQCPHCDSQIDLKNLLLHMQICKAKLIKNC